MQDLNIIATNLIEQLMLLSIEIQVVLGILVFALFFSLLYLLNVAIRTPKINTQATPPSSEAPTPVKKVLTTNQAKKSEDPFKSEAPAEITDMEEILDSLDDELDGEILSDLDEIPAEIFKEAEPAHPAPASKPPAVPMPPIPQHLQREPAAQPIRRSDAMVRQSPKSTIAKAGKLVENIPRAMRVNIPLTVEARIADDQKADLKSTLPGRATEHQIQTTPAMTVLLRAPEGGFAIEPLSLETQWVNNDEAAALGFLDQPNFGQWQWRVTPTERGRKKLKLYIAAHTATAGIPGATIALPQQEIEISVKVNYPALFKKIMLWITLAVIGGLIAKFGENAMMLAFDQLT